MRYAKKTMTDKQGTLVDMFLNITNAKNLKLNNAIPVMECINAAEDGYAVAADTRRMLVVCADELPVLWADVMKKTPGKYRIVKSGSDYDLIFAGEDMQIQKFPDYKRVIPGGPLQREEYFTPPVVPNTTPLSPIFPLGRWLVGSAKGYPTYNGACLPLDSDIFLWLSFEEKRPDTYPGVFHNEEKTIQYVLMPMIPEKAVDIQDTIAQGLVIENNAMKAELDRKTREIEKVRDELDEYKRFISVAHEKVCADCDKMDMIEKEMEEWLK